MDSWLLQNYACIELQICFTFCFIEPSRFFLHLVKHRIKSTFLLRAQSPAECSLLGIHTKFIFCFLYGLISVTFLYFWRYVLIVFWFPSTLSSVFHYFLYCVEIKTALYHSSLGFTNDISTFKFSFLTFLINTCSFRTPKFFWGSTGPSLCTCSAALDHGDNLE